MHKKYLIILGVLLLALFSFTYIQAEPVETVLYCVSVDIEPIDDTLVKVTCLEQKDTPTETIVPTKTITPIVTTSPTPTLEPTNVTNEPSPDDPLCEEHPQDYHTLYNEELDCHYDHEHGDDLHALDELFGLELFDWMGGEISYPWETPNENLYKHGAYNWYVREDIPFEDRDGNGGCSQFGSGCVRNGRALVHGEGAAEGNVISDHSFYAQLELCPEFISQGDYNGCGTVSFGGWQGQATLNIDGQNVLVPELNNPQRVFLSYYNEGNRCCSTWYNGLESGIGGVVVEFGDMWNTIPIPPNNLSYEEKQDWIVEHSEMRDTNEQGDSVYHNNSSKRQLHIFVFAIPPRLWDEFEVDPNGDGTLTSSGYLDRRGYPVEGCTEIGLDCIPYEFNNVYIFNPNTGNAIQYQYRGDYKEYDIQFNNGDWSNWIKFPINTP